MQLSYTTVAVATLGSSLANWPMPLGSELLLQGTLAQLDTQNPVLYIDFPQGRLKFFGQLMFPKNKYMVLKAGSKDVLCEDVFDMLVRPLDVTCCR